jgi:hypothetical protein
MDEELIKAVAFALVETNEPGCDPKKWWGDYRDDGSHILRWHMGYRDDAKAAIRAMVEYYRTKAAPQEIKGLNTWMSYYRIGAGLGCLCGGLEFSVMYPMPFRADHYALHCTSCGRLKETHDGDKVTRCIEVPEKK